MIPAGAINCSSMSAVAAAPTKFETSSPSVLNAIRNGLLAAERRNKNVFKWTIPGLFFFYFVFSYEDQEIYDFCLTFEPQILNGPLYNSKAKRGLCPLMIS